MITFVVEACICGKPVASPSLLRLRCTLVPLAQKSCYVGATQAPPRADMLAPRLCTVPACLDGQIAPQRPGLHSVRYSMVIDGTLAPGTWSSPPRRQHKHTGSDDTMFPYAVNCPSLWFRIDGSANPIWHRETHVNYGSAWSRLCSYHVPFDSSILYASDNAHMQCAGPQWSRPLTRQAHA